MTISVSARTQISTEIFRIHSAGDHEIARYETSRIRRRNIRKSIFDLLKIEENLINRSLVGLKADIAEFNLKNRESGFQINFVNPTQSDSTSRLFDLTKKEREILDLLPLGLTINQLAKKLHLTESTVKTHLSAIYRKLSAKNRVQAIAIARANKLLTP